MKLLTPPIKLIQKFPTPPYVTAARFIAKKILERKDSRLAVLVGPCSIHDPQAALEFALRLKKISVKIEKNFFPVMRLFIEKPRSRIGWKGMVYDPYLDQSNDMEAGLHFSRKLLTEIGNLEIACSMEFLDPLISFYFHDTISWGFIGARTPASQPHRQMASMFDFPLGFKNDIRGNLEIAIDAILSAQTPHSHIGIDPYGRVAALSTKGNPWTHLVLRGAEEKSNYDPFSLQLAAQLLKKHSLEPRLLIDCSHGNSGKDAEKQKQSFTSVIEQVIDGNQTIAGLMLESHIFKGKQSLEAPPSSLLYGVSITDSCLSWEETESLLLWADDCLSSRSKSIHSVQN